jgi:hypothetical protein
MGLIAKEKANLPPTPEGVYQGICYAVYDLGTHLNEKFNKSSHQCLIIWELPEVRIEIERDGVMVNLPKAISKKYTLSLSEKAALRKDLQSWRGRTFTKEELEGFDLTKLLSVNCMIQVIHTTKDNKTYANIASIAPLYKGIAKLEPENPLRHFSMSDDSEIPDGTPDWIIELINDSAEWTGASVTQTDPNIEDQDVPF